MPMEAMDYKQFILEVYHSEYSNSNECQSIISFFLIISMHVHITVEKVVVEEARAEQSVFRHVHLLPDQVPRFKPRVAKEVEQGMMVRDCYVFV